MAILPTMPALTLLGERDMTVTMELRDLPERLVEQIKLRAVRHGRTPEQEAQALLEKALVSKAIISPRQILAEARAAGIRTPSESVRMVREDRDAR
jgi:plasmid stability protein